jgi:hypothetical protein
MIARLLFCMVLLMLAVAAPAGERAGARAMEPAAAAFTPCRDCAAEAHSAHGPACETTGHCATPLLRREGPALAERPVAGVAVWPQPPAAARGACPETETPPPRRA